MVSASDLRAEKINCDARRPLPENCGHRFFKTLVPVRDMAEDMDGRRFPEALKKIFAAGDVPFPALLVGLSRYGGWLEFPPLQYMVQALPVSGFFRPLMNVTSRGELEKLAADFAGLTGFRRDAVGYLFGSFAYALGLRVDVPRVPAADVSVDRGTVEDVTTDKVVSEASVSYGEDEAGGDKPEETEVVGKLPGWNSRWTAGEKARFLTSLISVNHENERRNAMRVLAPACVSVETYNFKLTAELRRVAPRASGALFYAVYGRDGNLLATASLGVMCYDDVSVLPREAVINIPPESVAAIVLYWD